jgi:hypothetical protein
MTLQKKPAKSTQMPKNIKDFKKYKYSINFQLHLDIITSIGKAISVKIAG